MTLTTKEKAERYDALQMAIKATIENYEMRIKNLKGDYAKAETIGTHEIIIYGEAIMLEMVIQDMERWVE